ncbi:hypothetical protein [Saccharothrix sp.]|uniref:hypothetical protein n=1 Tax=Saccharothrix sp. TaxID=1873460 RepID=UPI002810F3F8|nr:hypothetical protein [Saccharothrix sp.]
MSDHAREDDRREAALGREVRRELSRWLAHHASGAPTAVDVVVRVARSLSAVAEDELRASVDDQRREYPGAIPRLAITVDRDLPAPGFTVEIVPVVAAAEEPSAPITDEEPDEDQDEDQLVLTLKLGRFRFPHVLRPSAGWVPVSRRGPGGIVFPDEAEAVPRAALVELRNVAGNLHVRRTGQDRRYIVAVGGQRVEHGRPTGIGVSPRGRIVIREATGDAVATIDYELHDRFTELRTGGATDTGDGTGIAAWVTGGGSFKRIHVEAPPAGVVPSAREFTGRSARGEPHQLRVRVLYTRAEALEPGGEEVWHVKVYRCDTPEDAAMLRAFLEAQIGNVERANGAVGGSNRVPPWVIAPVHLLSLARPAAPRTRLADKGERIPEGVAARLAGWFGVADQPDVDTCVLVASPWVSEVGWVRQEMRPVPGRGPLEHLRRLARGLDLMHGPLGIAHGDIKPANVCRLARADGHDGYVLIDADSIGPVRCPARDARPTDEYTSADYRAQWENGDVVDLRALDRFGFVLVTIAAVASPDRLRGLLDKQGGRERVVDSHPRVVEYLTNWWSRSPRWQPFAEELAAPFAKGVFADPDFSLEEWVDRLIAAHDRPGPQCGHPGCPPAECVAGRPRDDHYDPPYAEQLRRIRDEVRSSHHIAGGTREAVIRELRAQQAALALAAYRGASRSVLAAVTVFLLIVVVSLKLGGVL